MADEASSSAAPTSEGPSVNISIVSPSLSVNAPLSFPGLSASTTIGQLKQNIRHALESKPTNEQQRLIHQGKLLAKEDETLLHIFGEQRIRDTDQFIIHLVIRDVQDHRPSNSQSNTATASSPSTPRHPSQPTPPPNPHGQPRPQFYGNPALAQARANFSFASGIPGMPAPPGNVPISLLAQQRQQLLQDHLARQRAGALPANQARGAGDGGGHATPGHPAASSAPTANHPQSHFSPQQGQPGQTYVQEGVGPNGEFYRVTTNSAIIGINGQVHPLNVPMVQQHQASAPGIPGFLTPNDVHNVFRNADTQISQATSIMTDAMHRSTSGASSSNLNIQTPGSTVHGRSSSTGSLSRAATPDRRTPSQGTSSVQATRTGPTTQPQVYILNSPQGPRALLVNNSSEMYYTPAPRHPPNPMVPHILPPWFLSPPQPQPQPRAESRVGIQGPAVGPFGPAQVPQQAPAQGNIRVQVYQGPGGQQPAGQQPARDQPLRLGAAPMHPANPEGGLAGALVAALWPHIWLLIRLAVFVWWFTSADTSWTRWLMIMGLATAVFLVNTGIFNGIANDMFQPIRQHLEGLIPFAGPEGRNNVPAPAQANGGDGQPQRGIQGQGDLDPAQVAARLMEERRGQNANWLMDQVRRIERAGLLLLASILPGVAERHIARLEAEARAERERQEAAERAERESREEEQRTAAAAAAQQGEEVAAPETPTVQASETPVADGE